MQLDLAAPIAFTPMYRPGAPWAQVLTGLGIGVAGVLVARRAFVLPLLAGGVLATLLGFGFALMQLRVYLTERDALDSSWAQSVEGDVARLEREDPGAHSPQSFVVNGVRFFQSTSQGIGGLQPRSQSSVSLRDGLRVRIIYMSNGGDPFIVAIDSAMR